MITARAVRKSYRGTAALDGIDLTVGRGELVALLGPNGAGKTTLVETLAGYRRPDSGTVEVLGTDPAEADLDWRARVGFVLQEASDFGELTSREVLVHFARYYGDPMPVDEALATVDLVRNADKRVSRLSGGQRRRLDVALSLLGRPDLVFLDEPTSSLDPEAREAFWQTVTQLRGAGTTFLLTTHDLREAERLADRIAVLVAGRIAAEGSPEELAAAAQDTATVSWQAATGIQVRQTTHPTELLRGLLAQHEGEVPDLRVQRPRLADVYGALVDGAHAGAEFAATDKEHVR